MKNIMKVLIDDHKTYKIKDKNKSDHNTFIIDIEKTINNNKKYPKYSWKINNNTNWNAYKNTIENKIECKPRVQQITYASTYVRLVKQVVQTMFFQHTLTYIKESSIAYTRSIMTKYL